MDRPAVLIVDDMEVNRDILSFYFRKEYTVLEAADRCLSSQMSVKLYIFVAIFPLALTEGTSVSYTHLDVYKRQAMKRVNVARHEF